MPGAPSNQPCLTVLGGPMSGTQFAIEDAVDNILIGADSSCRFCIPLPGVSPIHARIWLDAGGATVYDTHSPRGLYVNDDRVNGQAPLKNGDILWLGTPGEQDVVMIQCRLPRTTPAPEPSPPVPPPPEVHEVPEATLVMASEPMASDSVLPESEGPPPEASEFYVAVEPEDPAVQELHEVSPEPQLEPQTEPPSIEVTTVLDGPPADFDEPYLAPPEEPSVFTAMPEPAPRPPTLETEFEDETTPPEPPPREADTIAVTPEPRPQPTPVPLPPAPARTQPPPTRPPAPSRPVAAPRPAPAAPRPSPAPTPVPRAEPPPATSPMRGIVLVIAIVAILVAGGLFVLRWLHPTRTALVTPTPAPASTTLPAVTLPSAAPATPPPAVETPAPPPPVEEVVTIVKSPSPRTSPSPSAAKPSPSPKGPSTPAPVATPAGPSPEEQRAQAALAQVAGLLGQAEAAAAARPEEALRLYDEVLKLDPQNARAVAGRTATQSAAAAARKRFAAGRTSVQSSKSKADLSGFDSADVQVADAPGRIDFESSPAGVKPGDSYAVKFFFVNESKKPIKVKSLSVSTLTNGTRSGGPATSRVREIAPGQRALLGEVTGAWKDGTTSWSTDVVLVSERNDSYRNQVSWR